ncbi:MULTISPECIES: lysophospholipid acyltransferase family protein [Candidatus Phytoplasma]|uniref:1-acyl-sn-glycerol-3-phosphate acyltransferase n=2 Tax=Candidatus Phytoplasma TaxID=33926 RepID=A0ABN0J8E0_PEWBP|nr:MULTISPECIES: lysophospholipid acyltransferase family protein [Phytoplasma]QLL37009.1 1-acyl-sn-glycerol-3-phosphate acyltransferase ['Echinacea purpurea' witches'-broom phytoplasma]WEX20272.1 MAG: 1-acyl-sn-glycerol-3-phosphate acyltransferase [Candidatus Phytoplasma aurantifolia]WKV64259.1 MAG: 1-acyl-sn-glycerol-3-phosphate acyltransferase [Candidatus Phytoplasma australasiaticum]EMR14710.1 1-acyl-sn-glycerol-3-phosphate acyltransferase [Peanut witches'-broom phytoplasma NTU2011]MDO80527
MFSFIFLITLLVFWYYFIFIFTSKIIGIFVGFVLAILISWLIAFLLLFISLGYAKQKSINNVYHLKIVRSFSKLIMGFFRIKVSVYNYNLIPFNNRLVIYTNHKSNFDPFIIASIFPRPLTFTPKDELYNNFWYGWFLRFCFDATHCIKINRGNNRDNLKSLEKAKEIIKEKLAVLVFPEGGIINSTSDQINSSLDGAYKIAIQNQADILPITCKGIYRMRGKCWFRLKKVELLIHPYISYSYYKDKKSSQINHEVTNIINSRL